jgi:hypothetical protein
MTFEFSARTPAGTASAPPAMTASKLARQISVALMQRAGRRSSAASNMQRWIVLWISGGKPVHRFGERLQDAVFPAVLEGHSCA